MPELCERIPPIEDDRKFRNHDSWICPDCGHKWRAQVSWDKGQRFVWWEPMLVNW